MYKMRGSADLICRGIAANLLNKLGNYRLPLSFFSSSLHNIRTLHNIGHKDGFFSPKPRIDFSCVNEVDDDLFLIRTTARMQPCPTVADLSKLLNVIFKMKRYSDTLCLFDKMHQLGAPLNEYTLNIAINCYCLLGRSDFGFAMFGNFFKCGCKPDSTTYNILIEGLFFDDKVAEVNLLLEKLSSLKLFEPNELTFLIVIIGLCEAKKTLLARDLLGSFETSYRSDVESCNPLIDRFCEDGLVDEALLLLSKMIDKGISPNVVTYTSIIHCLCNYSRWHDVQNMVAKMMDHKISLSVLTVLVDAMCKEGKVEEAENVMKIMMQRNIRPNIVTYNALIDGYCMKGKMDKAREIFDSIEDKGLKPSVSSYNTLINGYCKKGMMDEAWCLFLEVPSKGLKHSVDTYNTMIHGLLREGKFSDGWELLTVMESHDIIPDLHTYNILLDSLCKTHQITKAFSFLHMMEDKGINPDIFTYNILIDGLCKNDKTDVAGNLFKSLYSKGLEPNIRTYNIIIGSLCQEGLVEKGESLLKEMVKSGCVPDDMTYNIIVRGFLKRNEFYKLLPFFEKMHKRGISVDSATMSMLIDQL